MDTPNSESPDLRLGFYAQTDDDGAPVVGYPKPFPIEARYVTTLSETAPERSAAFHEIAEAYNHTETVVDALVRMQHSLLGQEGELKGYLKETDFAPLSKQISKINRYQQFILEFGTDNNPKWMKIAFVVMHLLFIPIISTAICLYQNRKHRKLANSLGVNAAVLHKFSSPEKFKTYFKLVQTAEMMHNEVLGDAMGWMNQRFESTDTYRFSKTDNEQFFADFSASPDQYRRAIDDRGSECYFVKVLDSEGNENIVGYYASKEKFGFQKPYQDGKGLSTVTAREVEYPQLVNGVSVVKKKWEIQSQAYRQGDHAPHMLSAEMRDQEDVRAAFSTVVSVDLVTPFTPPATTAPRGLVDKELPGGQVVQVFRTFHGEPCEIPQFEGAVAKSSHNGQDLYLVRADNKLHMIYLNHPTSDGPSDEWGWYIQSYTLNPDGTHTIPTTRDSKPLTRPRLAKLMSKIPV